MLNYRVAYYHHHACGSESERVRVHEIKRLVVKSYRKTYQEKNARKSAHRRAVSYHLVLSAFVEIENSQPAFLLRQHEHKRNDQRRDYHKPGRGSFEKIFVITLKIRVALFPVRGYQFVAPGRKDYPPYDTYNYGASERYRENKHAAVIPYNAVYREFLYHDDDIRDTYDYQRNVESACPFGRDFKRYEHDDHRSQDYSQNDERVFERGVYRELLFQVAEDIV